MNTLSIINTKYGFLGIVTNDDVLKLLILPTNSVDNLMDRVSAGIGNDFVEGNCPVDNLTDKIRAYFEGEKVSFDDFNVDFDYAGSFSRTVLENTRKTHYGQTMTYSELARISGNPNAARAVGNTMANNKTPLIVPCHRVIKSNNTIGGFSGGSGLKKVMLEIEGVKLQ